MAAQEEELTMRIFEAFLDPASWPAGLVELAGAVGGVGGVLGVRDSPADPVSFMRSEGRIGSAQQQLYKEYYGSIDPHVRLHAMAPLRHWLAVSDRLGERFVSNNEYYNDYLRPAGVRHIAGCRLQVCGYTIDLRIHRGPEHQQFTRDQLDSLARQLPAIHRALTLCAQMEHARLDEQAAASLLDRTSLGVIATTGAGRVIFVNGAAEAMVALSDGLQVKDHRLRLAQPSEDERLAKYIKDAATGTLVGGDLLIMRPSRRLPFAVSVIPAAATPGTLPFVSTQLALILITDQDQTRLTRCEQIRKLFGLTVAEATLAAALAEGKTIAQIAAETKTAVATQRTHLRAVLAKTGTARQADIVRLVLTLPPFVVEAIAPSSSREKLAAFPRDVRRRPRELEDS